jgi:hypothetical protein
MHFRPAPSSLALPEEHREFDRLAASLLQSPYIGVLRYAVELVPISLALATGSAERGVHVGESYLNRHCVILPTDEAWRGT